jgi:hypothetical protein
VLTQYANIPVASVPTRPSNNLKIGVYLRRKLNAHEKLLLPNVLPHILRLSTGMLKIPVLKVYEFIT